MPDLTKNNYGDLTDIEIWAMSGVDNFEFPIERKEPEATKG